LSSVAAPAVSTDAAIPSTIALAVTLAVASSNSTVVATVGLITATSLSIVDNRLIAVAGIALVVISSCRILLNISTTSASSGTRNSECLVCISRIAPSNGNNIPIGSQALVLGILWGESKGTSAAVKVEQLRVGYLAASISPTTAGEEVDLGISSPPRVEADAGLRLYSNMLVRC